MQLQLRPAVPRFHPLLRPMYRRAGFAGLGLTPGYSPTQQAMADAFAAEFGGGGATYQAPTLLATPACALSPDATTADSAACQQQLFATNLQNIAAGSAANYSVDRTNCETDWAANDARYASLGLPRPPNTCAQETFGLTLPNSTGGSNILIPNAQSIFAPNYSGPGSIPRSGTIPTPQGSLKFTNLTSGNNSQLAVGDRWQIQISGAIPNGAVTVMGGQNGAHDTTPMGNADLFGNWTSNGQISAAQVGSWSEAWSVGGQPVGQFSFTVVPASGSGTGAGSAQAVSGSGTGAGSGQTVSGSFMDLLSKSTTIGGASIPDWALIGGALVAAYFLFMRGK